MSRSPDLDPALACSPCRLTLQVLVRHKADPAATDHDGKTPYDLVPAESGTHGPLAVKAVVHKGAAQGAKEDGGVEGGIKGKPRGKGRTKKAAAPSAVHGSGQWVSPSGVPRASLPGAGEQAQRSEQAEGATDSGDGGAAVVVATRGEAVRKLLWSLAQGVNEAAAHGDEWRIKHLVEMGATVRALDAEGYTALGRAVAGGFHQVRYQYWQCVLQS